MTISGAFNEQQQIVRLSLISGVPYNDLRECLNNEEIQGFNNKSRDPSSHGLKWDPTGISALMALSCCYQVYNGSIGMQLFSGFVTLLWATKPQITKSLNSDIKREVVDLVNRRKEDHRQAAISEIAGMIGMQPQN
jgi:hypothetical protein